MSDDIVDRLDEYASLHEDIANQVGGRFAAVVQGDSKLIRDAIAEITRLRGMTEWRPIETAPKDGTEIIVGSTEGWCNSAQWGNTEYHGSGWLDGYDFSTQNSYGCKPLAGVTHWLPLPSPPGDKT